MLTKLLVSALILVSPMAYSLAHEHHHGMQVQEESRTIVVNLTEAKGLKPTMAVRFATVALQRGHKAVLWLNSEAVVLAQAGSKSEATKALKNFMDMGGKVYVCPVCAQKLGVKKLIEGVEWERPDHIFSLISDENTRLMNW